MTDPAPSGETPAPADKQPPAKTDGEPQALDDKAFTNTKQHVASRQADSGTVERFTNTKLNIALINDPKNGPRFTLTKRESGLSEEDAGESSEDASKPEAKPDKADKEGEAAPPASESVSPSTADGSADGKASAAEGEEAASDATPAPKIESEGADSQAGPTGQAAAAASPPPNAPPGAEPPSKLPIDSSKTFVGPNGTYYDESWRWMDWRGTRRSWNWPAALSLGHWFAYRRLFVFAGIYGLWLAGLSAAAVNAVPILAVLLLGLIGIALTGLYGNTLYFFAFRRAVDHVTRNGEGSYEERHDQLAAAGGTSMAATGTMAGLTITGIAVALALTHYLRGGLDVSLWPFF